VAPLRGYRPGMDHPGAENQPSPLIHLDDQVDVAAQLVQRFGYEEAERILLDALDDDASVDDEVRRSAPNLG
jgi:hypothetical protein